MKTILFCGNGMSGEALSFIANEGYIVLLISDFPKDRGLEVCTAVKFTTTKNPEYALRAALELTAEGYSFDGVLSLGWDCAESVSAISNKFGLFGIDVEKARNCTNKILRSTILKEHGVPTPDFGIVNTLKDVIAFMQKTGNVVVLKPDALSSSKGVVLISDEQEALNAFEYTRGFQAEGNLIVNEFICGSEHSVEGIMINGKLFHSAISDRPFLKGNAPFFVDAGDILPSLLDEKMKQECFLITERAATALEICDGVVKTDLLVDERGLVWVLELACRLGGPRFGTEIVPLSNGTDILKAAVQQAVGEPIDTDLLRPKSNRGVVYRALFPKPGKIVQISGIGEARRLPGFYDFKWFILPGLKVGDVIAPPENSTGNVGYFIATGETRDDAEDNADRIEAVIKIVTI